MLEGKQLNEKQSKRQFIFTKSVQDYLGISPGLYHVINSKEEEQEEIVGICENVNLTSLRHETNHVAFVVNNYSTLNVSYIRLQGGSDFPAALEHIRKTLTEIVPVYPVEINFMDDSFDKLYKKDENLNKMITLFSLLAILISIVGVFGLVVFETQYRKKEIGICKVMGAEVKDILIMFNKSYFLIVVGCFIVSVPVAYYCVLKWLENFASKTPIYPWVFAIAFILVALIVGVTVTLQNWRAATENPVDSIKTE
ncbi:MAG: FtsX-like permease family protein [Tannerellaceae bacterium]|nr:FtsX-like permease family protein [Tannerellaceae bacterium]